MELSIVSTLYKSEPYVERFVELAAESAAKLARDFEIILVNDGSPDRALDVALHLRSRYPQLRIVDLSKNFGHHRALMTGLCFARGARVFLIDSDLEESPNWVIEFSETLKATDADVVYGVQRTRKGGLIERAVGALFYWVVNLLSPTSFQTNSVTARLMSSRYVAALTKFQEREFAIGDLWVNTGFKQVPVTVEKKHRGDTSYSLSGRAKNAVLGITSTSTIPLTAIFVIGLLVSVMSGVYIAYLILLYWLGVTQFQGWASLIVSIWFFGGMTLSAIGTVGIYVARIFQETKSRPYVVIREVYDANGDIKPQYNLDAAGAERF